MSLLAILRSMKLHWSQVYLSSLVTHLPLLQRGRIYAEIRIKMRADNFSSALSTIRLSFSFVSDKEEWKEFLLCFPWLLFFPSSTEEMKEFLLSLPLLFLQRKKKGDFLILFMLLSIFQEERMRREKELERIPTSFRSLFSFFFLRWKRWRRKKRNSCFSSFSISFSPFKKKRRGTKRGKWLFRSSPFF